MFKSKKKNFQYINWKLLLVVAFLCVFGLVILYSATLSKNDFTHVKTQIIATLLGWFLIFILIVMDFDVIKKLTIPAYILGNALLVLTLFRGVGGAEWGSDSWIVLGPVSFQPSEFMKVILILTLSLLIEKYHKRINEPKILLRLLIVALIPIGLIGLQPDIGTAMVFLFFVVLMFFAAGVRFKYFVGAIVLALVSLPIIYSQLKPYQKNRIRVLINPEEDVTGIGWQFNQGAMAVGSGQLRGRGLFKGAQTQYNFISLKENDYIFAVLGEELGF